MGMPLTHGLMLMHNALVGTGLRDQIKSAPPAKSPAAPTSSCA